MGARESASLTSTQGVLLLLVWGPHLENQGIGGISKCRSGARVREGTRLELSSRILCIQELSRAEEVEMTQAGLGTGT